MNRLDEMEQVDVLIVGLGPTGLSLAHLLGKRGLRVVALEREPKFYGNARAVYTDDECMRIFQAAGVADDVGPDMMHDMPSQFVLPGGKVLAQYVRIDRPNGWPVINFLYQPYLETKLESLLARYPNVTVRRGRSLLRFEQDEGGVTATHTASEGTSYGDVRQGKDEGPRDLQVLRARYLVACDGGRSTVRQQLDIKMDGKSFPEPWLVVDLKAKEKDDGDCFRHLPYFSFHCDPANPTVCCPQPDGHFRFEFMLMAGQTKESMEDPATVRSLIAKHVDPDRVEVLRKLVYTFNALSAQHWRSGRVLLAGDAAHMTPQFMGQGMSSGIRDAFNLAWKLDAVVRGQASDALLDSYQRERGPHAKKMIDVSVRVKDFVSQSNPWMARLRNVIIGTALVLPKAGDYLRSGGFKPEHSYERDRYVGLSRRRRNGPEGRVLPQPLVRTFAGRNVLLDEVIGEGWALLGFGVSPADTLDAQAIGRVRALSARCVTLYRLGGRPQGPAVRNRVIAGLSEIEDLHGDLHHWLKQVGGRPGDIVIVRPDKFVFALVQSGQLGSALEHLFQQLGGPENGPKETRHEQSEREDA